jgi:hypothetical protein
MSKDTRKGITRRQMLKGAGFMAAGAALGPVLGGCARAPGTASGQASITVYDINGAHEISSLFAARLGDLNGKKVAGLAADPTKWQTHRTFPYIFDQLKSKYPGVIIIPQTEFTMGTGISDDAVVKAVKDRGADACIIGNAA